ncbi:hypothetical protein LJC08_03805 [Methanimicrococcus sp. OttesenSCG-928-J09]|nr:hypothetical protein [Methanimicrococcus sp. OttesenSCG-928-J09]
MYTKLPNLILGFHGCSEETCQKILKENETLRPSTNSYDWLGHGVYFWENNYDRALEWAKNHYSENYGVIGAVIDLGYCLNLSDSRSIGILERGYDMLTSRLSCDIPKNRGKKGNDILLRDLDCAVIQQIHIYNGEAGVKLFDSVRGLFIEGEPVYNGSGFFNRTHIQICVRNPNSIKGYFMPLNADKKYPLP